MSQMTPEQYIEQLRKELLEAYITRSQADEKIKAILATLGGINLGVEIGKQQAMPPVHDGPPPPTAEG